MTCKHAPSGCNYPEGDCPGTCLGKKINSELRARIEIEGTIFEITRGTDDLAEFPGRVGLWINPTWCGGTVKTYFDGPNALFELQTWLEQMLIAVDQLQSVERK